MPIMKYNNRGRESASRKAAVTVDRITNTCVSVIRLVMGMIGNNVYVVDDGEGCLVIDPSCDEGEILTALEGRRLDAIVLTHGHGDHVGAAAALREATGAPVIASAEERPYVEGSRTYDVFADVDPCPVDRIVGDGDILEFGNVKLQVIATPGHTPGGISLYVAPTDDRPGAPVLFSGDTLFAGTHGRVDLAGGDIDAMRESLVRLSYLPPETVVMPGHNALTTIARELGWLKICRL